MKKIRPFPVPLKSRSLEYLTSDRKKLRRSNRTGPKLVQNSSRGKWKGRKTPPSPPSSAFRFVRVPRCNIEMIYIFVGCQWPPKSCTVRMVTSILPFSFFLFIFLRNNNDSFGLRRLEMARNRVDANREKSKSGFPRITWKFGTREWCDNGGGTANRSVWSRKWRAGNIKERKRRRGNRWSETERALCTCDTLSCSFVRVKRD